RVNVSLDSLDPERYNTITRGGDLNKVKNGVKKALELGFKVKINTVVLKDLTENEIITLVEFGNEHGIEIRFIEFMPLCGNSWNNEYFVPISTVKEKIEKRYNIKYLVSDGVTDRYSIIDGDGKIGFITTMSEPFCSSCSRLRLTARGTLRPCLFSSLEVNVFKLLREERPDEEIENLIKKSVYLKPEWNPVLSGYENPSNVFIRNVGG
nr:radical SAM protein [Candidatus Dadabacteria bacterium]